PHHALRNTHSFPTRRSSDLTSTAERVVREIEVHGGVTNWYIEVSSPPQSFRVELGYKAANGRFFSICRSNIVQTPAPDSGDVIRSEERREGKERNSGGDALR